MKIVVRGEALPSGQAHAVAAEVRNAFRELAHRVAAVLVAVSTQAEKRHAARHCVVEVHMADGHVEYVEERQRRLGAALRRAVQRAWKAAARWLRQQLPVRGVPVWPAMPGAPALVPIRTTDAAGRGRR